MIRPRNPDTSNDAVGAPKWVVRLSRGTPVWRRVSGGTQSEVSEWRERPSPSSLLSQELVLHELAFDRRGSINCLDSKLQRRLWRIAPFLDLLHSRRHRSRLPSGRHERSAAPPARRSPADRRRPRATPLADPKRHLYCRWTFLKQPRLSLFQSLTQSILKGSRPSVEKPQDARLHHIRSQRFQFSHTVPLQARRQSLDWLRPE
jgi:hypothetical protein